MPTSVSTYLSQNDHSFNKETTRELECLLELFLPYLEAVHCSMSSSICGFLTCIQVSPEAGQVVCYSQLLKNFPEFVVIHTVKGFSVVNKAEVDVFLEFSCFFYDPTHAGNLSV